MGCHVWFERPVTDEEFEVMKKNCLREAKEVLIDGYPGDEDVITYNKIKKSFEENIPCVDGQYWYQLGWGGDLVYLETLCPDIEVYIGAFCPTWLENKLYTSYNGWEHSCIGELRVKTYPHKIIHNKKELRRYFGKKYFTLSKDCLDALDSFWKKYPEGILHWG